MAAYPAPGCNTPLALDQLPAALKTREADLLRLDRAPSGAMRIVPDPVSVAD